MYQQWTDQQRDSSSERAEVVKVVIKKLGMYSEKKTNKIVHEKVELIVSS